MIEDHTDHIIVLARAVEAIANHIYRNEGVNVLNTEDFITINQLASRKLLSEMGDG